MAGPLERRLPSVSAVLSGEFMQLGSKENENERFKHYLEKTFKKTASLIANSCKAVCTFLLHTDEPMGGEPALVFVCSRPLSSQVSILVNSDPEVHEIAFQYGKNVGIAFQVVRSAWGTYGTALQVPADHATVCLPAVSGRCPGLHLRSQ